MERGVLLKQGHFHECFSSFKGAGVLVRCIISPSMLRATQRGLFSSPSSLTMFLGKASLVCSCPNIAWRRPSSQGQRMLEGLCPSGLSAYPVPPYTTLPLVNAFPLLQPESPSWTPSPCSHTPPTCMKVWASFFQDMFVAYPISSPWMCSLLLPAFCPPELETVILALTSPESQPGDGANIETQGWQSPCVSSGSSSLWMVPLQAPQPHHWGDRNVSFYRTAEWLGLIFPREIHLRVVMRNWQIAASRTNILESYEWLKISEQNKLFSWL